MAVFTYTITNPGGVDLSLFFPGTLAAQWFVLSTTATTGAANYRLSKDGVLDTSKSYAIAATGSNFTLPPLEGVISGLVTSATLSVTPQGSPATQLATLAIALGAGTAGGIAVPSFMDMTPDSIQRPAARLDSTGGGGTDNGAKLILHGGDGNDTLPGSSRADTLDGGRGADKMIGGSGNDLFIVDSPFDVIVENSDGGSDTLITTVGYRLADNAAVEIMTADAAAGGIGLTGNAFANQLFGNAGNNRLDGGAGADAMTGGLGDDTYVVDNALDVVNELAAQGTDTVLASASYALGALAAVEFLRTVSPGATKAINLTGSAFPNTIFGNAGANKLSGQGGNDKLFGGLGKDTLTGGDGRDIFAFTTKLNKVLNVDVIKDFNVPDDAIWLENSIFKALGQSGSITSPTKLKSASFFIGSKAHDSSDRIIYDKATGALFYDADGTGPTAQIKFAQLTKGLKMTASDFFVI